MTAPLADLLAAPTLVSILVTALTIHVILENLPRTPRGSRGKFIVSVAIVASLVWTLLCLCAVVVALIQPDVAVGYLQ